MHRDLQHSSLERLPATLRRLAKSMIFSPLTKDVLSRFADAMKIASPAETLGFLPVYHFLLDPTRIPATEALDDLNADTVCYIWGGLLSLKCLHFTRPPLQTGTDIMPRMWIWAYFLYEHQEFLAGAIGLGSMKLFYINMMEFCGYMFQNAANQALMRFVTGSRVLAAHAWTYFSERDDFLEQAQGLATAHQIMTTGDIIVDEILEGISGNIYDLAVLVMRQCALAVPLDCAEPFLDLDNLNFLEMACDFVARVSMVDDPEHSDSVKLPLGFAVASLGIVETLTIAAHTLSHTATTPDSEHVTTMDKFVVLLAMLFERERGDRVLRTAMQQGLLSVLLSISRRDSDTTEMSSAIHNCLLRLLIHDLTPSTIYYHVLGDLEKQFDEISTAVAHLPCSGTLMEVWRTFVSALRARLICRTQFDSHTHPSRSVCGNSTCGIIVEKSKLKRCSRCRSVLYCSRECQTSDWRCRHRVSCDREQLARARTCSIYTRKEYSFLKFLLHEDYLKLKSEIALDLVSSWAAEPDARLLTLFDYRSFPAKVNKCTSEDAESHLSASFRSTGLGDMQVMCLRDGRVGFRKWIFRLARENQSVPDRLKEIAQCADRLSAEEIRKEVETVVQSEGLTTVTADF
ncbi:hypothetical protein R3P38DRAFT_3042284 [Favolaschia claudopus]|uniref:MYND-type domain-containing protein n=1 Tax=Favolaschia claudopus TaxID=2862362 RepID=A0AAW0A870_9AGAR